MVAVVAGATGAAIAIAAMELLAEGSAIPLLFVPFATSIVLVMGSPQVAAAQPRALIGGHLVATVVGSWW
jgi:CBS-domain-containing membrane protein